MTFTTTEVTEATWVSDEVIAQTDVERRVLIAGVKTGRLKYYGRTHFQVPYDGSHSLYFRSNVTRI